MNPTLDTKYGGGEWIWNLKEASEREAIKAGRKISSCAAIAHSTFPNMGWCMSSNRAVVTDGNGNPAYPSNPLGACSGQIITDSTQCAAAIAAAAAAAAAATPTGAAGGSPLPAAATCTDGNLTPGCLRSIVTAQCNATGSLAVALNTGYANQNQQASDMNSVLRERNFNLPSGILADGRMTQAEAVSAVTQLKTWGTDSNYRAAGAANNLCYGTSFDMCGVTNTTQKPFSATCISRAAQAAGWSPNGTAMPARDTNMSMWSSLNTWGDVLNQITTWKQKADNPGTDQLDYIRKVYGMSATYPNRCPSVTLREHCGPQGWSETLSGAGTFMVGTDFKPDASYITVPRGATAELTNRSGDVEKVVGPKDFNFCSRGGFNDNVRQIKVYMTDLPPTRPTDNRNNYVMIGQSCAPKYGEQITLGPGSYFKDKYPGGKSIVVPSGTIAVLKDVDRRTGILGSDDATEIIVGPAEYSFCRDPSLPVWYPAYIDVHPAGTVMSGCEGESANLSCSSGVINSINVKYGKWEPGTCPGANSGTTQQRFFNKKQLTPANCVGKSSCTLPIDNSLAGDPMGGTRKHWVAATICEPSNSRLQRFQTAFNNNRCSGELTENDINSIWGQDKYFVTGSIDNNMRNIGDMTAICSGYMENHKILQNLCMPGKCP
jgi:hypothetical protein